MNHRKPQVWDEVTARHRVIVCVFNLQRFVSISYLGLSTG